MTYGDIDSSPSSRAKVGLAPATTSALVGWGRRPPGAGGWYLDARRGSVAVVYVLGSDAHGRLARLRGGGAPPLPMLAYHRDHAGRGVEGRARVHDVAEMVAIPDGDGRFLAAMLRADATEHLATGALETLIEWCLSDPVFLLGAIACTPPPPSSFPSGPSGRLGVHGAVELRVAQRGYELLLGVAELLVDHPGRWGGGTMDVARRVAEVLQARYRELAPSVAAARLTRTVDAGALPMVPAVGDGDEGAHELLAGLWATWAFGPRATVVEGRELVRRLHPDLRDEAADRLFVQLLVALQLASHASTADAADAADLRVVERTP